MTTIKLSGGGLGGEQMMVRCNLTQASAPVEVDYCNRNGEGYVQTQYQCADTSHTTRGLIELGKILAAEAVGMSRQEFACDAAVID